MKIVLNEQYFLIPQGVHYDLYEVREVKKADELLPGKREVCLGYSMQLSTCIKKVISNNLDKDVIITMKEYLEAYKAERKIIEELFADIK